MNVIASHVPVHNTVTATSVSCPPYRDCSDHTHPHQEGQGYVYIETTTPEIVTYERTIRAGRGRLECGTTSSFGNRLWAAGFLSGGLCSDRRRLMLDCQWCADGEPLLGQLCLIWLNVAIYVLCMHIICIQCNPENLNPIP